MTQFYDHLVLNGKTFPLKHREISIDTGLKCVDIFYEAILNSVACLTTISLLHVLLETFIYMPVIDIHHRNTYISSSFTLILAKHFINMMPMKRNAKKKELFERKSLF
jgi:hypothetical protein